MFQPSRTIHSRGVAVLATIYGTGVFALASVFFRRHILYAGGGVAEAFGFPSPWLFFEVPNRATAGSPVHEHVSIEYANLVVDWGLAISVVALFIVAIRRLRRSPRAATDGKCRSCGYNLTGNESGVCPECGEGRK